MISIEQIRSAISKQGAEWQAAETPIFRRGARIDESGLFGLRLDGSERAQATARTILEATTASVPPAAWDWRAQPNTCLSPVKDQGQCGACVAFATNAVLEFARCKKNGTKGALSEAQLFFCNGGSCEDGWGLDSGLQAAKSGVGLDKNHPWSPTAGCKKIPPAVVLTKYAAHTATDDRKRAVAKAPVLAGMRIYEDFLAYKNGIYSHVSGEQVGAHAICVVGYSDPDQCWIVKNSWGPDFGEQGFFRIKYAECGLDSDFSFFSATI